ncbi:uncharacterized protein LOC135129854 [Zophobas morio]|uniref:uncharacterized protein LOC135129854 n=1 Tax=Zophobas morio TaxID=2755281 RepID=UPI0030830845
MSRRAQKTLEVAFSNPREEQIDSSKKYSKPCKTDLENTTITLLREQNEFLRAELDELKKSFKDSVKHILDEVEERVSMLFENLRDDLKSSITTSVRQEFDGFKPVVDTIFKTNLGSIFTNQTPAYTPSETDKPYLPKSQLFNRRKIILLADGKGRNCVKLLNEYLSHNEYDVSSIIKPNASFEMIVADNISTVHCQDIVMIFGGDVEVSSDFNTPKFGSELNNNFSHCLNNFVSFCGFCQYNHILNNYDSLLDLIFSTFPCTVLRSDFFLVPEDPLHPTLLVHIDLVPCKKSNNFCFNSDDAGFNFRKADFPCLYDLLLNYDWSNIYNFNNVDDACEHMYTVLYSLFDLCVPKVGSSKKTRRIYSPWFHKEIIKCLRLKSVMRRKYAKTHKLYFHDQFRKLRSDAKKLITNAYTEYLLQMEKNITLDPKKCWSFVRSKRGVTRIPGTMFYNDECNSDPNIIVNSFAHYFKSVFIDSSPLTDDVIFTKVNNTVSVTYISEDEIIKELKRMKNSMTSGPDSIPSFLLKDCAHVLSKPLLHIFNIMLKSSTFPNICPVLKKGDPSQVTNYRPISILCNFSKVFESILYARIYTSVKNYISEYQHGFMQGKSTITNLAYFSQFASNALDRNSQVDVIYTDFQKAFDQIDHYVLLNKLETFAFSNSLLVLLKSYLLNKRQQVVHRKFKSIVFVSTSGVPQGSNFGPLLFLMYINDITDALEPCNKLLFADDLKIFMEIVSIADCVTLQNCLNVLSKWCCMREIFHFEGKTHAANTLLNIILREYLKDDLQSNTTKEGIKSRPAVKSAFKFVMAYITSSSLMLFLIINPIYCLKYSLPFYLTLSFSRALTT